MDVLYMISVMLQSENRANFSDIKEVKQDIYDFKYKNHSFKIGWYVSTDSWGEESNEVYLTINKDASKSITYNTENDFPGAEARILFSRLLTQVKEMCYKMDDLFNEIIS